MSSQLSQTEVIRFLRVILNPTQFAKFNETGLPRFHSFTESRRSHKPIETAIRLDWPTGRRRTRLHNRTNAKAGHEARLICWKCFLDGDSDNRNADHHFYAHRASQNSQSRIEKCRILPLVIRQVLLSGGHCNVIQPHGL
jgi:hypothetical protein